MLASLRSAALFGVDAYPVHVEVDVAFGLPPFLNLPIALGLLAASGPLTRHLRYGSGGPRPNAGLRGSRAAAFCRPDAKGRQLLRRAIERLGLSARGYDRALRVARTVADLTADDGVTSEHVAEALQYRVVEHGSGAGYR